MYIKNTEVIQKCVAEVIVSSLYTMLSLFLDILAPIQKVSCKCFTE